MALQIKEHNLVPEHSLLNSSEKDSLLQEYHVVQKDLPKILAEDPAIAHLGAKAGDVIKIVRKSQSAGDSVYFRGVING